MRIRKTVATLALCAAGMSVLGAGTAVAEEVVGHFDTAQQCSAELQRLADQGDPGPLMCEPTTDDDNGPQVLVRG
ncbi:hypothetical protein [Saccharopolyspora sp. SCSIO 74807]|uniref:hypothetical protein n=1 Tax=Saccharopolyspora sp. SCSIO 74807 TaxID=3118084 RepID=UPI0030D051F7